MNKLKTLRSRTVPVTLKDGMKASVQTSTITNWDVHHGKTAAGVQVHSLLSKKIGDSIIIATAPNGPALSVSKDDFEVAAAQILTGLGYELKAPK